MNYEILFKKTSSMKSADLDIGYLDETNEERIKQKMKYEKLNNNNLHINQKLELSKENKIKKLNSLEYIAKEDYGKIFAGGFIRKDLLIIGGIAPEKMNKEKIQNDVSKIIKQHYKIHKAYKNNGNDLIGHKLVLSFDKNFTERIKKNGLNPDYELKNIVKKTMTAYQKKFVKNNKPDEIGYVYGLHHDTDNLHAHILLLNKTKNGQLVGMSQQLKNKIVKEDRNNHIDFVKNFEQKQINYLNNKMDKLENNNLISQSNNEKLNEDNKEIIINIGADGKEINENINIINDEIYENIDNKMPEIPFDKFKPSEQIKPEIKKYADDKISKINFKSSNIIDKINNSIQQTLTNIPVDENTPDEIKELNKFNRALSKLIRNISKLNFSKHTPPKYDVMTNKTEYLKNRIIPKTKLQTKQKNVNLSLPQKNFYKNRFQQNKIHQINKIKLDINIIDNNLNLKLNLNKQQELIRQKNNLIIQQKKLVEDFNRHQRQLLMNLSLKQLYEINKAELLKKKKANLDCSYEQDWLKEYNNNRPRAFVTDNKRYSKHKKKKFELTKLKIKTRKKQFKMKI